jgi:geranylgeranyl pyrophosphate synthase
LQTKKEEDERFRQYLSKTFHKTASLIAYSCKAAAVVAGAEGHMAEEAYEYGRSIGIAFQLVDDLLDFKSSSELLGRYCYNNIFLLLC